MGAIVAILRIVVLKRPYLKEFVEEAVHEIITSETSLRHNPSEVLKRVIETYTTKYKTKQKETITLEKIITLDQIKNILRKLDP